MQERSEKPTSRKLKKARERGEIPKSSELVSSMILVCVLLLLWWLGKTFLSRFEQVFSGVYQGADWSEALYKAFTPLILPVVSVLIGAFLVAGCAHFFQTGFIFLWKRSKKNGKPRWVYPLLKFAAIIGIGYFELNRQEPSAYILLASSPEKLAYLFSVIFFLLLKIAVVLLLLGICDFFYQKWKYDRQMRMTPQEVKEEKRETEGNPEMKSRLRNR